MKFVRITHPDVEGPAVVSERAAAAHAKRGWELDTLVDNPTPVDPGPRELHRPQKNDSTAKWRTYAVANGMALQEAFDMGRDDIIARFADDKPAKTGRTRTAPPRTDTTTEEN